jgi:hypothetical protein
MDECKVLEILLGLSPTLHWLHANQPAKRQTMPPEHCAAMKRLEEMGVVSRRSHNQLSLQKQRLHRLVSRELLRCPRFKERCEAEFRSLFHSDKAVI